MGSKNAHRSTQAEEAKKVTDWLIGLVANFCDEGIIKLMPHVDKCLNCNGDYIEK
jgi:hypothetical protein